MHGKKTLEQSEVSLQINEVGDSYWRSFLSRKLKKSPNYYSKTWLTQRKGWIQYNIMLQRKVYYLLLLAFLVSLELYCKLYCA